MMGFSQQSRIYFTAYGALVCCCFGFYPFASHLPVCFLSVVFNGMPFWLHKIGWYTALMKMLDKCSFLELTSGMLYKTFLNMLAAALSVMKSWKLEVLLSLCGQLRTVFSALPSFAVNFERNYFSWNFLGPLCNAYNSLNQKNYSDILKYYSFFRIVCNDVCLLPFASCEVILLAPGSFQSWEDW